MKKTIIILGLTIIFAILLLNIDFENKKLIIGNTTYALTIDGVESTSLPTSGNYYLTSYTCKNGSIVSWDSENHKLKMKKSSTETETCSISLKSNPLLNEMKVGDYVAYVGNNGCNNGVAGTTGTGAAEAGNSCKGENANQSTDTSGYTYGYCYSTNYKYYVYGWRIAYIENNKVYLTSAGSPECRTRTSSTGNATQIEDLNTAALDYCNATYADGGTCSSSNTWAMGNTDFQKITNAISGTTSNLTSAYGSTYCYNTYSLERCGYNNDLIDNGGYYWFAAYYTPSLSNGVGWYPHNRLVNLGSSASAFGFRPIISLSSNVYVTDGSGTMEDPYTIAI